MSTGKWREEDVPHKGWQCVEMDDLEDERAVCEMCEAAEIRFVHVMAHQDHAALRVGCVCAEHMEQDYVGPRKREAVLARRRNWLRRRWYREPRWGAWSEYIRTDHFHIAVWPVQNGWGGEIIDLAGNKSIGAKRVYPSAAAAKLAAFDAMVVMKERRP